jgi:hypothetical protein
MIVGFLRQFMPSFGSPSLQNFAAALRFHSCPKTVDTDAAFTLRLISSLWHRNESFLFIFLRAVLNFSAIKTASNYTVWPGQGQTATLAVVN